MKYISKINIKRIQERSCMKLKIEFLTLILVVLVNIIFTNCKIKASDQKGNCRVDTFRNKTMVTWYRSVMHDTFIIEVGIIQKIHTKTLNIWFWKTNVHILFEELYLFNKCLQYTHVPIKNYFPVYFNSLSFNWSS